MLRATGSSGVSRAVRPSRTPARPSPTDPPEVPVLWIDDEVDPDNAAILILRHAGVAVTCAQTAAEGLRLAKLNTFRAILLDLRLPDGDGLQVLRELRREGVAVPVMIVTGFGDIAACAEALRMRAHDFREKEDLIADELVEAVWELVKASPLPVAPPYERPWISARTAALRLTGLELSTSEFLGYVRVFRETRGIGTPSVSRLGTAGETKSLDMALMWLSGQIRRGRLPNQSAFARMLGMSQHHARRMLHNCFSLGFEQVRRALRLQPTLRPVLLSDDHYAQIAFRAGYDHPSQLTRDFRRLLNVCPKELRALLRDETLRSVNCLSNRFSNSH